MVTNPDGCVACQPAHYFLLVCSLHLLLIRPQTRPECGISSHSIQGAESSTQSGDSYTSMYAELTICCSSKCFGTLRVLGVLNKFWAVWSM